MQDQNLAATDSTTSEAAVSAKRKPSDDEILERIYRAIVQQRLAPGAKLGEESLCEVFGVSRTRIRRVLLSLSNRRVVELFPNRGAFVARPSAQEARHVFEARRAIELPIVRRAAERADRADIRRLLNHIEQERRAQSGGDRETAIALSGGFHLLLAEIAGNLVLAEFLANLVSRSSLIIGLYGVGGAPNCSYGEHEEVATALANSDVEQACTLIEEHLRHTERGLRLSDEAPGDADFRRVFAEIG